MPNGCRRFSLKRLVGRVLASSKARYRDLFRPGGFAKSIEELSRTPHIGKLLRQFIAPHSTQAPSGIGNVA